MMAQIEPTHRAQASFIFQIIREFMEPSMDLDWSGGLPQPIKNVSLLTLFFAVSSDITPDMAQSYTEAQISTICEDMESRLTARCAGLLELKQDAHQLPARSVQYLHRTMRDFIHSDEIWQDLLTYSSKTSFHPLTAMMKSLICQLSLLAGHKANHHPVIPKEIFMPIARAQSLARSTMVYAYFIEQKAGRAETKLLDQLDEVMKSQAKRWQIGLKDVH